MTCSCGNPECQGAPDQDRIRRAIAKNGLYVIGVLGDETDPDDNGFCYTIGRTDHGEPELVAMIPPGHTHLSIAGVLNGLKGCRIREGHAVSDGTLEEIFHALAPDRELIKALHEGWIDQADHYYGRSVEFLMLVPESAIEGVSRCLH